jgi:putative hydrolase of the HAD superfamily
MPLKTIIFDMGNVLVHFCHDRMCRQIGALSDHTSAQVRQLLIDSQRLWDFERGRLTAAEFHRDWERLVDRPLDPAAVALAASDIFALNEPIVPVLDALRSQGLRLVLLSNTSIWHYEFIWRTWDVLQRFDETVLSFEVGAIKPEPEIYRAAIDRAGCAPHEAFYTDDIPRYVEAGRQHGLQAEVFVGVPQLREHLRRFDLEV